MNASDRPLARDCRVTYREDYRSSMVDFHSHEHYEVSLILSGNVKSLLQHRAESGPHSRLVLTAPRTPHFIFLESPSLYSRINLAFTHSFVADYVPEWRELVKIFGQNGNILLLNEAQCHACRQRLEKLMGERNPFRQRLRILELLSLISEFDQQADSAEEPPPYVLQALAYINGHYAEHIVAARLAWKLEIGRTTLMTAFRKHTGTTLVQYVTRVRLKKAILLLRDGISQEVVAERTGFGNGGGLIRAFRSHYGMTPKQYMKSLQPQKGDAFHENDLP